MPLLRSRRLSVAAVRSSLPTSARWSSARRCRGSRCGCSHRNRPGFDPAATGAVMRAPRWTRGRRTSSSSRRAGHGHVSQCRLAGDRRRPARVRGWPGHQGDRLDVRDPVAQIDGAVSKPALDWPLVAFVRTSTDYKRLILGLHRRQCAHRAPNRHGTRARRPRPPLSGRRPPRLAQGHPRRLARGRDVALHGKEAGDRPQRHRRLAESAPDRAASSGSTRVPVERPSSSENS